MNKSITFSSYINAYSLYEGCKKLNKKLYTTVAHPLFPIPLATDASTAADWLLFTEEASLLRALKGELRGNFLPKVFPLELLDDKWALAAWLQEQPWLVQGLRQWPLQALEEITYPCLLKSKHSWRSGVKLPRGWICRNKEDVAHRLLEVAEYPDHERVFFFQEWLGDLDCRVISVCGFHDCANHERNLTAVVERISSHSEGLSCSSAVQTVPDFWNVSQKTAAILDRLGFVGPYEMEFLVVDDRVAVLELNPRFWLQHAIFFPMQNGLIKRYFGLDTAEDRKLKTVEQVVWFDTVHLVQTLLRLRFAFLRLFLKKKNDRSITTILSPSLSTAIHVSAHIVVENFKNKMARILPRAR